LHFIYASQDSGYCSHYFDIMYNNRAKVDRPQLRTASFLVMSYESFINEECPSASVDSDYLATMVSFPSSGLGFDYGFLAHDEISGVATPITGCYHYPYAHAQEFYLLDSIKIF
jgi:hypothetical protein